MENTPKHVIAKTIAWLKSLLALMQLPTKVIAWLAKKGESPAMSRGESQPSAPAAIMARKRTIREALADNPQCEMVVDSCESDELRQKQLSPAQGARKRLWCHIFLNNQTPDFKLVPWVIGPAGCHLRQIYEATGAEIRVRGRGSGFPESNSQEAPVPLMVAIRSEDPDQFKMATQMAIARLGEVKGLFELFCKQQKDAQGYRMPRQQKLWRFGEMSKEAETVLYEFLS